MILRTYLLTGIYLVLSLFAPFSVQAKQNDLSLGIVLPSNNDSVQVNPAFLGTGVGSRSILQISADPATLPSGNINLSVVTDLGSSFTAGLDLLSNSASTVIIPAIGIGFESFQLGFNMISASGAASTPFNLGLRFGKSVPIALVVKDILGNPLSTSIGIAWGERKTWRFELDINFTGSNSIVDIQTVTGGIGLAYVPNKDLSLAVLYAFTIAPTVNFGSGISFSANYWLSNKIAVLITGINGPSTVLGVKLKI